MEALVGSIVSAILGILIGAAIVIVIALADCLAQVIRDAVRAVFLVMLLGSTSFAQGVTPPPSVRVQDEGGAASVATTLNCTGAGISCSVTGAVATLNASGGGGGGGNFVEVSIDFGTTKTSTASVTVTGQAWVGASSIIVCSPFATTADGQTVENYVAARLTVNAATRVAATGFDLWIQNPNSLAGIVRVHCTGA